MVGTRLSSKDLLNVVVDTFNPSTRGQRQVDLCEFGASLGCKASSRIVSSRAVILRKNQQEFSGAEAGLHQVMGKLNLG